MHWLNKHFDVMIRFIVTLFSFISILLSNLTNKASVSLISIYSHWHAIKEAMSTLLNAS